MFDRALVRDDAHIVPQFARTLGTMWASSPTRMYKRMFSFDPMSDFKAFGLEEIVGEYTG